MMVIINNHHQHDYDDHDDYHDDDDHHHHHRDETLICTFDHRRNIIQLSTYSHIQVFRCTVISYHKIMIYPYRTHHRGAM